MHPSPVNCVRERVQSVVIYAALWILASRMSAHVNLRTL
jgi:hypothetical protein